MLQQYNNNKNVSRVANIHAIFKWEIYGYISIRAQVHAR